MADQLDDLTNVQLRQRLQEHGMANMPVTDTTRKVLIKRLRNVLAGEPTTAAKTPRRETIHVARFSSGDESELDAVAAAKTQRRTKAPSVEKTTSSSRRATIGVTRAASKEPVAAAAAAAPQQPKAISTRRSSGRVTPSVVSALPAAPTLVAAAAVVKQPIARTPRVGTLVEDSSDDDEVQFVPVSQPQAAARRSSRSPSMGKSATVVTSYKQVQAPATIAEAANGGNDDVDDDLESSLADTSGGAEVERSFSAAAAGGNRTLNYGSGSPAKTSTFYSSSKTSTATATYKYQPSTPARNSALADELIVSDAHTPYLSDFTRRLSQLRAEPLVPTSTADRRRRRESSDDHHHHQYQTDFSDAAATAAADSYAYRTSTRVHGRQSVAAHGQKAAAASSVLLSAKRAIVAFEVRFRYQIWAVVAVLLALLVFTLVFA